MAAGGYKHSLTRQIRRNWALDYQGSGLIENDPNTLGGSHSKPLRR